MRHDQISMRHGNTEVDIAAVWPAMAQMAPLPLSDMHLGDSPTVFRSMSAIPDVPNAVGMLIITAYAALIAALAFVAAGSREANFAIVVSALLVVMYFTVPRIILGAEPNDTMRPTFDRFIAQGMNTHTGHCSGKAALMQILIVPVSLTLGVLAMGIAAAVTF